MKLKDSSKFDEQCTAHFDTQTKLHTQTSSPACFRLTSTGLNNVVQYNMNIFVKNTVTTC